MCPAQFSFSNNVALIPFQGMGAFFFVPSPQEASGVGVPSNRR